jgi:hypothetical protein
VGLGVGVELKGFWKLFGSIVLEDVPLTDAWVGEIPAVGVASEAMEMADRAWQARSRRLRNSNRRRISAIIA